MKDTTHGELIDMEYSNDSLLLVNGEELTIRELRHRFLIQRTMEAARRFREQEMREDEIRKRGRDLRRYVYRFNGSLRVSNVKMCCDALLDFALLYVEKNSILIYGRQYDEGYAVEEEIVFCPFCGAKVECEGDA